MKIGICVFLGCLAAMASVAQAAPGVPKIRFDRTFYDLGKTSQVTSVTGMFVVRNEGTGELRIDPPLSSCSCTVVGLEPSVLQPGEKSELKFTLHLPSSGGVMQKEITVVSNDPQSRTNRLTVRAEFIPLYQLSPPNWYMVTLRKGEVTNLTAHVTRTDGKRFELHRIQMLQPSSTNWVEPTVTPEVIPGSTNMSAIISARLTAGDGPRYLSEVLSFYLDSGKLPAFSMPVSAHVLGDLNLNREMVYWAIIDPKKVVENQILTATSSLRDKLQIKSISSNLKAVSVQAVPKDDHTFEILAQLSQIPEQTTNGVIHIETNVPGQRIMEVPVVIAVFKPNPLPVVRPAR